MKVFFSFPASLTEPTPTLRERWEASWWNERVEWSDVCAAGAALLGGEARRERIRCGVALSTLALFLLSQCVFPAAMVLQTAHAAGERQEKAQQAQQAARKAVEKPAPAWAKENARRDAKAEQQRQIRLAQAMDENPNRAGTKVTPPLKGVKGTKPGQVPPSEELNCEDCEVDVKALDLRRVPTERELRRAGQLGGALSPLREAEPQEVAARLDALLKQLGMTEGLKTQAPANSRAGRILERAKKKLQRTKDINLSFGQAIQEWNKHNFRPAARMFEKHLKDYPESPWAGEAALHLGCDAKYNGRFAEAQARYDTILKSTSDKPHKKRKDKKDKEDETDEADAPAQDAAPTVSQKAAQVLANAASPEEAIDNIEDKTDWSFEVHQKAEARWADLDIAVGRFDEAEAKMRDVLATDTDWRRRTWAQNWLGTLSVIGPQANKLAACGPRALGYVLAKLDKKAAAERVSQVVPQRIAGLSLDELEKLANSTGVKMESFEVADFARRPETLAQLPTPLIVHYDWERGLPKKDSYFANHPLKQGKLVAVAPGQKAPSPRALSAAPKATAQNATAVLGQLTSGSGHYLVLTKVEANGQQVRLFDPTEGRHYTLSYAELAKQWSGRGLMLAGKAKADGAVKRLSSLQKRETVGGCCGSFAPPRGTGLGPNNDDCKGGNCSKGSKGGRGSGGFGSGGSTGGPFSGGRGAGGFGGGFGDGRNALGGAAAWSRGEPAFSINSNNQNVFIEDTPLWVETPKGPSVEIIVSYNSQDAITQFNQFGNKWMFNYGSYVTEDTTYGGGQILVFMPDGSQDIYYPDGNGGYASEVNNYNTLVKLSATRYEVRFPGGDKAVYDIPAGTTSLQPFLIELRDRWGYALTFGYDANVHLTSITDAGGGVTTLVYDAAGHVTSVWDPFGRHASFSYDGQGNLVECVDMEGHAFQYVYSEDVYVTRLDTAQGPWLFSHYYGYPVRELTVTDPDGKTETWHSEWWGPDDYFYRDKRGTTTAFSVEPMLEKYDDYYGYTYDARVSQERLPDGTAVNTGYNAIGLPTSVTDERGKTTTIAYNARGQVTSITDPKGHVTTMNYAANGLDVQSAVNANDATVMTATYDAFHQPLSVTDEGGTTSFTYTNWGAPATVTDEAGRVTTYSYNTAGRLSQVKWSDGQNPAFTLASYIYDEAGRVKTATDETGLAVSYQYNNLDHVTKVTYPDGTFSEVDYACCGLPGVVTDAVGRKTYYDYDVMKRLARVQDAAGSTLQLDYDADGNVVRLLDAKGNITKWDYDTMGRAVQKTYADSTTEGYNYAQGVLASTRGARGQVVSYSYDDNGNLTGIDYPNMADVSFAYNALDDVVSMTDGVGTHTWAYTNTGRLTSLNGPLTGDTQTFGYDALLRLQSYSVGRGASGGSQSQSYTYDNLERLKTLSDNGTNGSGTFTYNYVGNTDLLSSLDLPNGTQTVQSYDGLQRLTQTLNKKNDGTTISRYAYGLDTRDVRTFVEAQVGSDPLQRVDYSYDTIDQLTGEAATGGTTGSAYTNNFAFDSMGNRKSWQKTSAGQSQLTRYTPNNLNQIVSQSLTVNGERTTFGYTHDTGGNLTQRVNSDDSKTLYTYDDADQLIRVETRDQNNAPLHKSEFTYDGFSRKAISKEFGFTGGAWTLQSETRRVFDGLDCVQERNAQNEVVATYTRDGNIGGILSRTSASGQSYFHYDGSGNVTQLTDEAGETVARYRYDAFGNTLEASGARAGENLYRFSTKEFHAASGLYDYGFRFYSPSMGRWINRDPIQESGGLNLYGFVGNEPISEFDDYGFIRKSKAECLALLANIEHLDKLYQAELNKYYPNLDKKGGFKIARKKGGGVSSPGGHYEKMTKFIAGLERDTKTFGKECTPLCNKGKVPQIPSDIKKRMKAFKKVKVPSVRMKKGGSRIKINGKWVNRLGGRLNSLWFMLDMMSLVIEEQMRTMPGGARYVTQPTYARNSAPTSPNAEKREKSTRKVPKIAQRKEQKGRMGG